MEYKYVDEKYLEEDFQFLVNNQLKPRTIKKAKKMAAAIFNLNNLVDKEKPTPILKTLNGIDVCMCPNCYVTFNPNLGIPEYCPFCGQHLLLGDKK